MTQGVSKSHAALERQRIERAWLRSEAYLARSLRNLERTVKSTMSPRRVVRERLAWCVVGALVIGFALGWKHESDR